MPMFKSTHVATPFTSLHFLKAPKTGQRTPAALSDSYTGPYIEKKAHRALLVTT